MFAGRGDTSARPHSCDPQKPLKCDALLPSCVSSARLAHVEAQEQPLVRMAHSPAVQSGKTAHISVQLLESLGLSTHRVVGGVGLGPGTGLLPVTRPVVLAQSPLSLPVCHFLTRPLVMSSMYSQ